MRRIGRVRASSRCRASAFNYVPGVENNIFDRRMAGLKLSEIDNQMKGDAMVFYHHGAAIQPSVTRLGNTFLARVSILEEDGEATSLGNLGQFANRDCAFEFAVRSATAFVDGEPLPRSPFEQPGTK
jgi:hypothetical protein